MTHPGRAYRPSLRVCLIPGDGIGQEVVPAAAAVLRKAMPSIAFVEAPAGFGHFRKTGTALPEETLRAAESCDATLFGATGSPMGVVTGYRSPILEMRRALGLYANLRPTRSLPGAFSRPGVDLLLFRENTEDLYVGRERREGDTAIAERVITRAASERIARLGCEHARRRRRRVTFVHKANVLRVTDGLFREACFAVAQEFPDVACEELLVDAMAMRLVRDPESFDVIVTTNLFGDILSDEAAALAGGLGVAPSGNVGGRSAVFEPVHGSAPDIAGKGLANPIGAILSAAMLLDHLQQADAAARVRRSVDRVLEAGTLPADLGGTAGTAEVTRAVLCTLD